MTHGVEQQFDFRPILGNDTHLSSRFHVADGEFFSTLLQGALVDTLVWRPRIATTWLRATLKSPGPEEFTRATFTYEPDSTDPDGESVSGRHFFQDATLGVDINGDGEIASDDGEIASGDGEIASDYGEFLDVVGGSIRVDKNDRIYTFFFDVLLENGVDTTGSFEDDFVTISR